MSENKQLIKHKSNFWTNLFKEPTTKSDLENILTSLPLFDSFSSKNLNSIMKLLHNRVYSPNEYIFFQSDPGIGLYIILDGSVKIEQSCEDGSKIELAVLEKGDFFGELALLDKSTRSASAISLSNSTLAVIFKPDLDEFIDKHPKSGIQILRGFSRIIATRLKSINKEYASLVLENNKLNNGAKK